MSRRCAICTDTEKLEAATRILATGGTNAAIARATGVSHTSAARHRAHALVRAAEDAMGGEPARIVVIPTLDRLDDGSLSRVVREVDAGVAAAMDRALANGAVSVVAQLAGQRLRAVEVGAKLARVGGYGQPGPGEGGMMAGGFSVNIHLGGETVRITTGPQPVLEAAITGD